MFYIVSRGSTATHWLAKNLSKHKDLVCFGSSRSIPPIEPGKIPSDYKWIKDNIDPNKYLDSLLLFEKSTHNSKIFGSIHGYHTIEMKELVEKRGGTFKYMVRHPLELVHSAFIVYCFYYLRSINLDIPNEKVHDFVCKNLKNEKVKTKHLKIENPKPHFLRNYLSEKNFLLLKNSKNYLLDKYYSAFPRKKLYLGYEKDHKNLKDNLLSLFSDITRDFLCLQNKYYSSWGSKFAIKMEKLFSDKNYYKNLIESLSPKLVVSDEHLEEIFSTINVRVNVHRKKPITNEEISQTLPECMKEIFLHYFDNQNIQSICDNFKYKINLR